MTEIHEFFGDMAADYDAAIERCVPRYQEMLERLVQYVPNALTPKRICELGCGTGNLTRRLASLWPEAEITIVDISPEMIELCRQRLGTEVRLVSAAVDFEQFEIPEQHFDLVASSISLHHLTHAGKGRLFQRIRRGLRPNGVFAFADQMAGETPDVYERHMSSWRRAASQAGASEQEWAEWMRHQADHDHHESYPVHASLLDEAGFTAVDCLWRNLLWTIVQARVAAD